MFERPITDDNTVFILCTTEMDKMPKTLRSRCLIVPMRKPSAADVFLKLKTVCDLNDIRYDRGALVSLSEWSDGHFRDAENAITPLIMMGGINSDNVSQYTCHDPDATASLLVAMESNLPNALSICDDLCSKFGADTIHTSIIRILVDAISYGLTGMSSEIPDSYKRVYQALGSRMGNVLNHFISKARITDSRFMQAEVIQVYYKFLKGDMDLTTGMSVPLTSTSRTAKENVGKGSSGVSYLQEQLVLKSSSRRVTPKAEDAGPSLFGPEEVPQTNVISRN